jgi:hypothetical protein
MIAWLLFAAMLAGIFITGLYIGTMTERSYQEHKRRRVYRYNTCDTYTNTETSVKYIYGGKND